MSDNTTNNNSSTTLFCLCIRKLAFSWDPTRLNELSHSIPSPLCAPIVRLLEDIRQLGSFYPIDINKLPEQYFIMDGESRQLDMDKTVLASEQFLSKLDFFDLCAKFALDQPTERVYRTLSESEQDKLEDMDTREPVVWCRALELSPRRAILHYDDIAFSCATSGYLRAFERNLMNLKFNEGMDTSLLQRCALSAILNGQFHIANAIRIENFSSAFHHFFPDGHPPPAFIANLLDRKKLNPEIGEQIFDDIIDWLSKLDVQWLIRAIQREPTMPAYVLQRLESKYRECIDMRDYPCDYD